MKRQLKKTWSKLKRSFSIKDPIKIPILEGTFLNKRVALITGGGSGIGFAIAKNFVLNGSSVIICGRTEKKLSSAVESLKKSIKNKDQFVEYSMLDIKDTSSIQEALDKITSKHKIDILVNNAGISGGYTLGATSIKEYEDILDTNLKGTYFVSQYFLNYMRNNKIKGNILNVASASAIRPAISPYMISKWGILGLTKGLAKIAVKDNIVVNGIAPGPTATAMLDKDSNGDLNAPNVPIGRIATPEEIANLCTILVSDLARMVVGDVLFITGGAGLLTYDDIEY